jgi:pimeloyl-ACP methyl ester carboxylesterase
MNRFLGFALAASLFFPPSAIASPAGAAERTIRSGAATFSMTGSGSRAVILLPGLASGPYEFDGIRPWLAAHYTVYSVAFAGFDGQAPIHAPYLDAFAQSIVDLIRRERLQKPILIGHSLGGHLAVRIAATIPDNVGGVLAIDALPLFPLARPGETPDARARGLATFRDALLATPDDAYALQTKRYIGFLVTAPADVELVTRHDLASDRTTVATSAYEMGRDDLTPLLPKIVAPVEVLAPAAGDAADATQTAAYYTQAYAGTPQLSVVGIAGSKHFIMFDRPAEFASAVTAFMARVAP